MPKFNGRSTREKALHLDLNERQRSELQLAHQGLDAEAIAEVFGISRRTVDRDFKAALQLYQQQRRELAELVFDDALRALDRKIAQLDTAMYLDKDQHQQTTIQDYAVYDRWLRATQERNKLLNLYPHADDTQRSQVTVNQYYLSFDGSAQPADEQPNTIAGSARHLDPGEAD